MAQFPNAQHVIVQGGTFNSAKGDIHINNRNSESGLHALSVAISHGAIHDSAERYPPPNCHPDTRKAVRQIILDWIDNKSSAFPFFWLYGPAGAGKTAILQAIAEFMCSSSGCYENLGATFFFSREKYGRDQGHFLFLTIAYQLALKVPGLRQHVNYFMEKDPILHTKSIDTQVKTLIIDAFQSLSSRPQRSYLVIIDGLDECQDKVTQQSILRLLCETITVRNLPLRFLIGSRPESHIRASFDQKALYTITQRVVLDETFNPGRDIQVLLRDGFTEICAKHADVLSHVKQPWPEESIIDFLVQRSSGQFIYAATVLKFVGADFCSPTKQLALILRPNATAFSDLDQLYIQTPEVIEDILGMEEGEVKLVLRGLSSLIAFVGDKNEEYLTEGVDVSIIGSVYLIHASFRDYLVDSSRSGPFYVNEQEYGHRATTWGFALITKWTGRSWRTPSTARFPHSKTWDYFKSYLPNRLFRSPKLVRDAIMTDINDLAQEFWKVSSGGVVDVFFPAMRCLMAILKDVAELVREKGWRFTTDPGLSETESKLKATYEEFFRVFHRYQKMVDQSFISEFSKSRDMDLLMLLPGIVAQNSLTMQGMADLYRVKVDLLERLSKWTIEPFLELKSSILRIRSSYVLEDYLCGLLRDRHRSDPYYCDPTLHHAFICRRFCSLMDEYNASDLHSDDLPEYFRSNLYQHLCAATDIFLSGQNIPGNHPAVEILNDLESVTYHHLDANQSHCISYLAPYTIQHVLRWANKLNNQLKGATVFISGSNLIERIHQLTDRIYRQILCIEIHESMTTITLCAPLRIVRPRSSMSPDTPPCRAANPGVVQLSWELLAWVSVERRIPSFFTDFMTTPERSGPLYIRPDVYHTQITEYSLETIFRRQSSGKFRVSPFSLDNRWLVPDWSFEEHISCALPTEMILYLLGSIHFPDIRSDYTIEPSVVKIIIKWLEGLGSSRPSDLCDRLQGVLHQDKTALEVDPQAFSPAT